MSDTSTKTPMLHTTIGSFPLHEYHLQYAGLEWVIQHTGVMLTHEEESAFFTDIENRLPYGVLLWPSAIALACEVASRGQTFRGKRVLELGAGTGLPGIVASSLGAEVVQTDRHELAMMVCTGNCQHNGITNIEHRMVDWTDWQDATRYDWIIGSDILYADATHTHLRHIFETNLAPGGRLLISDPFRGISVQFLETLEQEGWSIVVTRWNLGEETNPRAIGIFELSK